MYLLKVNRLLNDGQSLHVSRYLAHFKEELLFLFSGVSHFENKREGYSRVEYQFFFFAKINFFNFIAQQFPQQPLLSANYQENGQTMRKSQGCIQIS